MRSCAPTKQQRQALDRGVQPWFCACNDHEAAAACHALRAAYLQQVRLAAAKTARSSMEALQAAVDRAKKEAEEANAKLGRWGRLLSLDEGLTKRLL
jgi:hypothetical protein